MKKVAASELKPGMKIAQKVENKGGMVLLPEGIELSDAHIGRLKKWGIEEVFIEGEDGGGAPAASAQIIPDLSSSNDFIAQLDYRFEKVKNDPLMLVIYNSVKTVVLKQKA